LTAYTTAYRVLLMETQTARTIIPKAHDWDGAKHDIFTCKRCVAKAEASPEKKRQMEAYRAWKASQ